MDFRTINREIRDFHKENHSSYPRPLFFIIFIAAVIGRFLEEYGIDNSLFYKDNGLSFLRLHTYDLFLISSFEHIDLCTKVFFATKQSIILFSLELSAALE